MHFNSQSLTFLLLVSHVIIPLCLILRLWRKNYSCFFDWLVAYLFAAFYNILLYFAGYWVYAGFYPRYILILLFAAASLRSLLRARRLHFYRTRIYLKWIITLASISLTVVMGIFIVNIFRSFSYDVQPVHLAFPLKDGAYAVIEGGNGAASTMMNSHYTLSNSWEPLNNESMKYALDIGKLNAAGFSANGLFPNDTAEYPIFGSTIYSPCDGEIISITDGMENKVPFSGENYYSSGNTMVIKDGDVYIILVHLQKGSMKVKTGDRVKTGDPLATVGNSGWTSEPHLHMQATRTSGSVYWEGESIPIMFGERFPIKNSLFFVR